MAVALVIPPKLMPALREDSAQHWLQVHLMNDNSRESVLGEYFLSGNGVTFQPLIPFTRGLTYEVYFKDQVIGQIHIPSIAQYRGPEVQAIYPTQDTVPENLLKIYIQFSRPMRESDPLSFVRLLSDKKDTIPGIFLDLRPALWDREGRLLTLWFDPGRIKRDLKPNQRSGPPLLKGQHYELIVMPTWPAKDGSTLKQSYSKKFFAMERDTLSPEPSGWEIVPPSRTTSEKLRIQLHESIDVVLLRQAMEIFDADQKMIHGHISVNSAGTLVSFEPSEAWESGKYFIRLQSRLEDLAGNNLNRLFDEDVTVQKVGVHQEFYELEFIVE